LVLFWFCFGAGRGNFPVVSGKEFFFFGCVAEEGFCRMLKIYSFLGERIFCFVCVCVCVCVFEVVKNWIIFGKRSE
jgi:hypothetical protein